MKFILFFFLTVMMSASQCKKAKPEMVPSCIQQRIESIKAQPKWNPPAQVDEYEYQGQKVYLFTSDCCDQYIQALDGSCNYICSPSGGITGGGDGKCTDFYKEAKHIRLIWRDER